MRIALIVFAVLFLGNAASVACLYHFNKEYAFGVVPLFNFDREANLPTLFAGVLLAGSGLLCLRIERWQRQRPNSSEALKQWKWVGYILLFLALDECAGIHENLDFILMPRVESTGVAAWPWVIPYLGLAFIVSVSLLRFFLKLPRPTQMGLAIFSILFVCGAIGMEMIAASYAEVHGENNLRNALHYSIEETAEVCAVLILLRTLFHYGQHYAGGLVEERSLSWDRSSQLESGVVGTRIQLDGSNHKGEVA